MKIYEVHTSATWGEFESIAHFASKEVAEQVAYWLRYYNKYDEYFVAEWEVL